MKASPITSPKKQIPTNNMKTKVSRSIALTILTTAIPLSVQSATFIVDFNDATLGDLPGQSSGSGTTGNWGGSNDIDVVAGDLVAPGSTNYAITQSGTAQSIQGPSGSNSRKANIALSTALTGTTIWGSYLVNLNNNTSGRGGIQFNTSALSDTSAQDPRIFALGTSVQGWLDGSTGAEVTAATAMTASATSLVLF